MPEVKKFRNVRASTTRTAANGVASWIVREGVDVYEFSPTTHDMEISFTEKPRPLAAGDKVIYNHNYYFSADTPAGTFSGPVGTVMATLYEQGKPGFVWVQWSPGCLPDSTYTSLLRRVD